MSLVIVVIFILCHSLRWIPNLWELKHAGLKKVNQQPPSIFFKELLTDRVMTQWFTFVDDLVMSLITLSQNSAVSVTVLRLQRGCPPISG